MREPMTVSIKANADGRYIWLTPIDKAGPSVRIGRSATVKAFCSANASHALAEIYMEKTRSQNPEREAA
jgi:hypothetical protein